MNINQNRGIKIDGAITLTSNLFVAHPQPSWIDNSGRIYDREPDSSIDAKPLNRTTTMSVIDDQGVLQKDIPFFPANGFRGRLRRKATEAVLAALSSTNQKVTIDAFHGMSCGAVTQKPSKETTTLSNLLDDKNHLFVGLFGGGIRVAQSGYLVSDLIPITHTMRQIGAIPEDVVPAYKMNQTKTEIVGDKLVKSPVPIQNYNLKHIDHHHRLDDVKGGVSEATISAFGNYYEEASAWLSNKDFKVTAMTGTESVIPGSKFYFNLETKPYLTDAQTGLMLLSLEAMIQDNALGGLIRYGFGKYDASALKITYHDEDGSHEVQLLVDHRLNKQCARINTCVEAAKDALKTITSDYVNGIFLAKQEDEGGKKSKSKSKSKDATDKAE